MSFVRRLSLVAAFAAVFLMAIGVSVGLLDLTPDDSQTLSKDSPDDGTVAKELPALVAADPLHACGVCEFIVMELLEGPSEPQWTEFSAPVRSPRPPPQFLS